MKSLIFLFSFINLRLSQRGKFQHRVTVPIFIGMSYTEKAILNIKTLYFLCHSVLKILFGQLPVKIHCCLQKPAKIILGIDPGTIVMGYGLIIVKNKQVSLLELGVLKPGRIKESHKKLQLIFNTVSGLITKYQPTDF